MANNLVGPDLQNMHADDFAALAKAIRSSTGDANVDTTKFAAGSSGLRTTCQKGIERF
ncbi:MULTISPECIES: hypothetical protein [Noviherbaspirillum]|uniref:hypothetical protein n=1 Tax=Noviherbaspirillum TaxID=1344552 RepID=UPI00178C2995|nr:MULTISPECIES: hypothetical protein [Noviherbaspirillum]